MSTRENMDHEDELRRQHQEFAYKVSHDVKAPIRHIDWYFQQLIEANQTGFDEESKKNAASAKAAINKLQTLMDDLTEYSRVHTSNQKKANVDLHELCERIVNNLRGELQNVGGEVRIHALPSVVGNDTQLSNLFIELISNAIKFRSEQRTLQITISSELTDQGYLFSVCDNGIGIPEKHHQTVFSIFSRAVGPSYAGNGAGLAIAKRIVEFHHGTITLLSPNHLEGTTINIVLPRENAQAAGE